MRSESAPGPRCGSRPTLATRTVDRANNFPWIRVGAATLVLFNHAFVLSGHGHSPAHALNVILGRSFAVDVFLIASGFLLARSFASHRQPLRFLRDRMLRILPGLAVSSALAALVLGPIVTTHSAAEYLQRAEPWLYPIRALTLIDIEYRLPGVFEALPVQAVNGSLWVLLHFMALYVVLAALGAFGVLDQKRRFAAFFAAFLAVSLAIESGWLSLPLPGKIDQLRVLAFPFLAACGAWVFRRHIVLDGRIVIVLLAVAAASHFVLPRSLALLAFTAAEVYLVLFVALAFRPIRTGNRLGQYSYGVFLYGFPITQCAMLAFSPGPHLLFLISVPLTFGIGFLSWELVERHALRLRKRPLPRVAERRELEPEPVEARR